MASHAVCHDCGEELLLPFSCKLRGICPSCNTRRMSNTAAHLMDHVIALKLTRERVRQICAEALEKLNSAARSRGLDL
jgi:hypothetical protein